MPAHKSRGERFVPSYEQFIDVVEAMKTQHDPLKPLTLSQGIAALNNVLPFDVPRGTFERAAKHTGIGFARDPRKMKPRVKSVVYAPAVESVVGPVALSRTGAEYAKTRHARMQEIAFTRSAISALAKAVVALHLGLGIETDPAILVLLAADRSGDNEGGAAQLGIFQ